MNRATPATGWVRNPDGTLGWTTNPITGCLNHVNGLCNGGGFPCYAYKLANGRLRQRYLANKNLTPCAHGSRNSVAITHDDYADPFYPRFWEEKLIAADRFLKSAKKPLGVFPVDMGDWCGIGIPESWSDWILELARRYPQHRFYLLTKQPQNLINFSPFPENCWVGVTATNGDMFRNALFHLRQIKASVKYLSCEPLLGEIAVLHMPALLEPIDWLIIGAQTKPYKPPQISWLREIVEAADKAGVKVFLKDNLRPLLIPEDCSQPNCLMDDIFWASDKAKLRQELPE